MRFERKEAWRRPARAGKGLRLVGTAGLLVVVALPVGLPVDVAQAVGGPTMASRADGPLVVQANAFTTGATIPVAGGRILPKAGVFADAQAEVIAGNLAAELSGRLPTATFDGAGACFVELGDGRAAFATGDFYAPDGPRVQLRRTGRQWRLAKVPFEQYSMRRYP